MGLATEEEEEAVAVFLSALADFFLGLTSGSTTTTGSLLIGEAVFALVAKLFRKRNLRNSQAYHDEEQETENEKP